MIVKSKFKNIIMFLSILFVFGVFSNSFKTIAVASPVATKQVTFQVNGGTAAPASQAVVVGGKITEPKEPVRSGYEFYGWYSTPNFVGNEWDFSTNTVKNNMTLYARWAAINYIVEFDQVSNGPSIGLQIVQSGDKIKQPADPIKANYKFVGWFTRLSDAKTKWNFETDTVKKSVVLFAKWIPQNIVVSFQLNNPDSPAPANKLVAYGDQVAEPEVDSRFGYVFDAWYDTFDFTGKPWDFDNNSITKNTVLYAKWTVINHRVRFETNGGTPVPDMIFRERGQKSVRPVDPIKEGYELEDWYDTFDFTGEPWDFNNNILTGNVDLYAKWVPINQLVFFETNGGQPEPDLQVIEYKGKAVKPMNPTKENYDFGGWYATEDFTGKAWDFDNDEVISTMVLYAKWTKSDYTVTFETNGGIPVPNTQVLAYGDKVTMPDEPEKAGYKFTGWYNNAGFTGNAWDFNNDIVTENTTLFAKWEKVGKITWFVEYYTDDADDENNLYEKVEMSPVDYGTYITLSEEELNPYDELEEDYIKGIQLDAPAKITTNGQVVKVVFLPKEGKNLVIEHYTETSPESGDFVLKKTTISQVYLGDTVDASTLVINMGYDFIYSFADKDFIVISANDNDNVIKLYYTREALF